VPTAGSWQIDFRAHRPEKTEGLPKQEQNAVQKQTQQLPLSMLIRRGVERQHAETPQPASETL